MKKLHSQRLRPTKSSPDIFILSHSKQKKQLESQNTHKHYNHPQKGLESKEKAKNLEATTKFQVLKSSVENHRQNIDRLTDVLKQKSWRKIRKDKSLRIICKWLIKQIQKNNIDNVLSKTLSFINDSSCGVDRQNFRQNRFAKLDKKGDCIERRSKNFDENGQLATLINEQAKGQNLNVMKQAKLAQSIQVSDEKSRSRSNSQRLISKNLYVFSKNTKLDASKEKKTYRTISQNVIPLSKQQQQLTKPKVFKSAQNIQDVIVTPPHKGNPQQKNSQPQNDTPSFSMKSPNPPSLQHPADTQRKLNNNNPLKSGQKLLLITPKSPQISQLKQKCDQKNQFVKSSAAIENYYFPFFTPPQQDTKQLTGNKARAKSLGKISFSYEDRQSNQKAKFSAPISKQQYFPDYAQVIQQLPLTSRACRKKSNQQRKRSRSLPKITFTYANTQKVQQPKNNMNMLQKNKVEDKGGQNDDPYLSRNLIVGNPRIHQKQIFIVQKKNHHFPYKQLVNAIVQTTPIVHPQKSNSKLHIVNPPHEIKLNMKNQHQRPQMKNSQYYTITHTRPTQLADQQLNSRKRVKSYDIFILRRPYLMRQWKTAHNDNERVRAKSCNSKLQVTLKRQPMIKVC